MSGRSESDYRSFNVPPVQETFDIDVLPPEPMGRPAPHHRPSSQHLASHRFTPDSLDPRRASLPALSLLRPDRQNRPPATPSLAGSDSLARGTTSRDTTSSALSSTNLYSLHGRSRSRQNGIRPASIDSRTSAQPVIVSSYPHQPAWSRSQSRNRPSSRVGNLRMDRASLPPLDAFNFDSIMSSIDAEVTGTLDAIADICANNRYSLANQYEVHMPPGGMHAQTFRTLEQSLIPVSEVSSERGSASPTNSRKSGEQSFPKVNSIPEPGEAAMDKLLSSSLAGGHPPRVEQKAIGMQTTGPVANGGELAFASRQKSRPSAASEPGVRRPSYSPQSLAASKAFLSKSSQAFKASRSGHDDANSPLRLLASQRRKSISHTSQTENNKHLYIPLISKMAPQIITDTRTNVVSGDPVDQQAGRDQTPERSGAFRAVSTIRDRRAHDTNIQNFLPSWLSSIGISSLFPEPGKSDGPNHGGSGSDAEGALREILQSSFAKHRT
ncbi:MAG: hypothetical protein M1814_001654 [Vezdaea aestivalis]|nr:MAG: hypothetical protein M1814_001654 [Vezdaea aestivalis]